ncbi:MAG TPA: acetoacetate decarboxylase family protein [Sphingomonadaceae bacterium]|nr:acetoacetate decarboxylase family protein [Sphingomonadaceae bacterium]
MPLAFGPAPGPRNLPANQRRRRYEKELISFTISARTDADLLVRFLPEGISLTGEARLEVSVTCFRKIGWLAGRGYDILMVRIPACWEESGAAHSGYFVPVVWENMADPIITGREELGWSKIYADIDVSSAGFDSWHCLASWDGHRFFELEAAGFEVLSANGSPPPLPMVFEKYVPATGSPLSPDARYLTINELEGPPPLVRSIAKGSGTFGFRPATWEEMPTQFPIATALASLPLHEFSSVIRLEASGGGDGSGQRKLAI